MSGLAHDDSAKAVACSFTSPVPRHDDKAAVGVKSLCDQESSELVTQASGLADVDQP